MKFIKKYFAPRRRRKLAAVLGVFALIFAVNTARACADVPPFDPAGSYNAYLSIQSDMWTFRNNWDDASFGLYGSEWVNIALDNNFFSLTGWDEDNNAVKVSGEFTDAVITGNGTYRVSLDDYDFGEAAFFNNLSVSTDIPINAAVEFTDIVVIIGAEPLYTFPTAVIATEETGGYFVIGVINVWNADLGGGEGLFDYTMPQSGEIAIEFTVSGFAHNNSSREAAETDSEQSEFSADDAPQDPEPVGEVVSDYTDEPIIPAFRLFLFIAAVIICLLIFLPSRKNKKK